MTYSSCIDTLAAIVRAAGVTVELFAFDLEPGVQGRFYDERNHIDINEPSALQALITLAHEAGHWMGYAVSPKRGPERTAQRERQACVYGWRFLVLCGGDRLVSRREWMEAHRPQEPL